MASSTVTASTCPSSALSRIKWFGLVSSVRGSDTRLGRALASSFALAWRVSAISARVTFPDDTVLDGSLASSSSKIFFAAAFFSNCSCLFLSLSAYEKFET